MAITYYPYDKQICGIEITSWGYTVDEVTLEHLYNTINLGDFVWVCFVLQNRTNQHAVCDLGNKKSTKTDHNTGFTPQFNFQ